MGTRDPAGRRIAPRRPLPRRQHRDLAAGGPAPPAVGRQNHLAEIQPARPPQARNRDLSRGSEPGSGPLPKVADGLQVREVGHTGNSVKALPTPPSPCRHSDVACRVGSGTRQPTIGSAVAAVSPLTSTMTETAELCPPPEKCIDNFLRDIERFWPQKPDREIREMAAWLRGLCDDPKALALLDRARRVGASVPCLLLAAAFYCWERSWLDGQLANVKLGLFDGAPARFHDIEQLLAQAEATGEALSRPSADAEELRRIKRMLDELESDVRAHAGKARTRWVRDSRGRWVKKKWIAIGAAVAVTTAEIGPAHAKLGSARGTPGNHALDVLLILVMGHLKAVSHEASPTFVVDLLLHGLKVGLPSPQGGAADPDEAIRQRIHRCHSDARAEHWARARIIARKLGLQFQAA